MRRSSRADGIVLVAVLLTCVALWAVLGALLLMAIVHYRVAVATQDHTGASRLLEARLDDLRAAPAADWPPADHTETDVVGSCELTYTIIEREDDLLRIHLQATSGRMTLVREATLHRQ